MLLDYTPELWTQFNHNPATNVQTLAKHIEQNKGQIIIVSDASLNAQHCSTFSWTIATASMELWTGAGTSPSTQCDAHSRRSKGYGFLSAFTFLEKYIQASDLTFPHHPAIINGYCDNSGLIQQIQALQNETGPNLSQTLSNDYDLSNEIHQTIRWIPIPVILRHVKGHQDNNTDIEDLPHEAQLNIACDE